MIDPYRANQYDLSLEWYHDEGAAVAVALFYKDVKSFITDHVVTRNFNVQTATAPSLACTDVGDDLFSCPFTHQRAHQRRRRRDPGRRVRGHAADLGRIRGPGELHLHGREGRQRRPDPGQLEGRVQRDRVLREPAAERKAGLQLSLRVLRRVRPDDAAEPGGDRVARRVGQRQCARFPDADLRGSEPDRGGDHAVCGLLVSARARSTTTAGPTTRVCASGI